VIFAATGAQVTHADAYDETYWDGEDAYATPELQTGTMWQEGVASGSGNGQSQSSSCGVHTYAWAKTADSANANATAWGGHGKDWVWNGPPGTEPGGTLSWVHDGNGFARVYGQRLDYGGQGSTYAAAYPFTRTGAASYPMASIADASVSGSVYDMQQATGGPASFQPPSGAWSHYSVSGYYYGGGFEYPAISWEVWHNGAEPIPEGTGLVTFAAAAVCTTDAHASVSGTGDLRAVASTYGSALVGTTANFP